MKISNLLLILFIALWAGEILGLTFIATPAKFLNVDLSISQLLGVGRVTFGVQEKVEWVFFGLILLVLSYQYFVSDLSSISVCFFVLLLLVHLVQYQYLLPILEVRTEMLQAAQTPPSSWHHQLFAFLELLKLFSLLSFSYLRLRAG